MEQQISISAGAIAAVAGLLGGMSLAIVALFGWLVRMWTAQRADWAADKAEWKAERVDHRARVDRLTAILEGQAAQLRRRKL